MNTTSAVRTLIDLDDEERTPCCPSCYLRSGESVGMLWDAEGEEFLCPIHDEGPFHFAQKDDDSNCPCDNPETCECQCHD